MFKNVYKQQSFSMLKASQASRCPRCESDRGSDSQWLHQGRKAQNSCSKVRVDPSTSLNSDRSLHTGQLSQLTEVFMSTCLHKIPDVLQLHQLLFHHLRGKKIPATRSIFLYRIHSARSEMVLLDSQCSTCDAVLKSWPFASALIICTE